MLTIKNGAGWWALACLGALLLTGCTPPGPRALLKGRKYLQKGDYAQAVQCLQQATELLKTNAQAFNYLGLACHYARREAEAENAYQRALALDHDLSEARYNLGCLLLEENKLDQAKTQFIAYTLRRSNAADGFIKLGTVQLRLRETLNAEKSFQDALRFQGDNAEGLTGLGMARMQRGKALEAAQSFQAALRHETNYAPALLNLAALEHQSFGDRAAALRTYNQYLAIKPEPINAAAVAAIVRQLERELGVAQPLAPARPSPARETNVSVARLVAADSRTNGVAASLPNSGRGAPPSRVDSPRTNLASKPESKPEPARPPVVRGTPVVSNSPPVSSSTIVSPAESVHLPAEPVFQTAVDAPKQPAPSAPNRTVPVNPPAPEKKSFLQKVNPLNLFGTNPKAEPKAPSPVTNATAATSGSRRYAYIHPARARAGNTAQAERVFLQGLQAHQAQKLAEAMQDYRKATQLDPAYFKAYYNLGVVAAESGNLPAAWAAYESALAIQPDSINARYNFALLLKQGNYLLDAADELQKVLTLNPAESRAHLVLANLYALQLGDPAKARVHYERVLETDPGNPQATTIRYWLAEHPQ